MNIYEVYKILEWWRTKGGKAVVLNDTLIFNYKSDSVVLDLAYSLKNQRLTIYRMYPDNLREFLAKRLGLAKGSVEIISGERSRQKSVRIHGLSLKEVDAFLQS